jgi:hypothetical protein
MMSLVLRQKFRKLRFQMIDDTLSIGNPNVAELSAGGASAGRALAHRLLCTPSLSATHTYFIAKHTRMLKL